MMRAKAAGAAMKRRARHSRTARPGQLVRLRFCCALNVTAWLDRILVKKLLRNIPLGSGSRQGAGRPGTVRPSRQSALTRRLSGATSQRMLVNSKRQGENIGYPAQPDEIDWFVQMMKKAAPKMAEGDLKTIETALKTPKKT